MPRTPDQPLDDDIVLADLGPFRPPAGYQFEDELQDLPPRLRTDELKHGRYAIKQRKAARGMITAGAMLAALGPLPFVQTIGLYVLPLAYLTWIGLGVLALGGFAAVRNMLLRGPYRYVEEGLPIVARVGAMRLVPSAFHHETPIKYRFEALIDYDDPETGEVRTAAVTSNDLSTAEREKLTTSYRVGDYATAIYLPHDPAKTLRLYGFLDLHPGLGLVPRDATPEAMAPAKRVLATAGVFAFLGGLLWSLYAMGRFQPLEIPAGVVAALVGAGAVVLGAPLVWLIVTSHSRAQWRRERRNAEALARGKPIEPETAKKPGRAGIIVAALGLCGIGAMFVYCAAISLNALLDHSPGRDRPAEIDEMVQVTHHLILREYKLKYHFLDDPTTKHEHLSTPAHLDTFDGPAAIAEVHDGRFGWPWVKEVRPAPHRVGP